jgi:hypothetical protein
MSNIPPADSKAGQGKAFYLVDLDQLRELIIEFSPDIRRDTERIAASIHELVNLERAKLGLDDPRGTIELVRNPKAGGLGEADFSGWGTVCGRRFRAGAWFHGPDKIRIGLLPAKKG